jgi:heme a synthase
MNNVAVTRRLWLWLPDTIDRRVRIFAWLSLISQFVIVGTGGLVRLTDSGLGCPTWPSCSAQSLVATPAMGIHGAIEFGNRAFSLVMGVIAVGMLLMVLRQRRQRRDLFVLAILIGLGIPSQALIGGLSVLTHLNPYIVGLHFVVSCLLVGLATALVFRVQAPRTVGWTRAPGWLAGLAHAVSGLLAATLVWGIVTTGSGPLAGDPLAARNGLDLAAVQETHSWLAYGLFTMSVVLLVGCLISRARHLRSWVVTLLAVEFAQSAVGVVQERTGHPAALVGVHMLLATFLVGIVTSIILRLKFSESVARSDDRDVEREVQGLPAQSKPAV